MAIQVMVEVWEHSKAEGSALLVLLAMADRARSEDAVCWPGVATVAQKARVDRRHAQRLLRELEEAGELRVVKRGGAGPKDTTVYQVAVGRYSEIAPTPLRQGRQDDTHSTAKGDIGAAKGDIGAQKRATPRPPDPTDDPLHRTGGARAQNGTVPADEVSRRLRSISHADRLRLTAKIETDYGHILQHVDDRTRKQMIETFLRGELAKGDGA